MSQAGIIEFESAHPSVPTSFVTNVGTAVPIANVLEILGTTVANHHIPVETTGTANIVTVVAQYAAATVATTTTDAGFASFNSAEFTVDANGWVSVSGSVATTYQANSGSATPSGGVLNIFGAAVAAGSTPVHTVASGNTLTVDVQTSQAIAATNASNIGLAAFNSADFTVDANGFVSTTHNGTVTSLTGNSGGAIPPDGTGTINVITAHASPIFVGSGHTLTLDFLDSTFGNLILGSPVAQTINPLNVQTCTSLGSSALASVSAARYNTAIGGGALEFLTTANTCTAVGATAAQNIIDGDNNTAIGYNALLNCVHGTDNTAIGTGALLDCTGSNNTSLGYLSLEFALGCNYNIAIGSGAGLNYTSTESSNILLANSGVLGESNVIRIGTSGTGSGQQSTCYVAGISGVTVAASAPVAVASTGQLSSLGFGTSTYVLTSNGAGNSPTWQVVSASGAVITLTGNTGTATPTAGNINIVTAHSTPTFVGASSTLTLDFLDPSGASNLVLGSALPNAVFAHHLTGVGANVLNQATNASFCVAIGEGSLQSLTLGNYNTMVGDGAGGSLQTGTQNSGYGALALDACVSGSANTANGYFSLVAATGSNNTAYGANSLLHLVGGASNIGIGVSAGTSYTGSESSNIVIGANGTLGESNTIRIGTAGSGTGQQNSAYVAGITGVTAVGSPVAISSTGQLSDLGFGTSTYVLTSNGAGVSPTWQPVSSSGAVENFTVDAVTGTGVNPVVPNAGNIILSADIVTQQGIPIRTQSPLPHKSNVQVQYCDSNATALGTKSGMSHFKSTDFTVDNTTGFVSLATPAVPFTSGTWTPILYGLSTAGTTTYNTQDGTYVQFGNLVWVRMYLQVATATGTGNAVIDGLPFTIYSNSASFTNSNLGVGSWTWPVGSTAPIFYGITGTKTGYMAMNGSALSTQYMQVQNGIGSFAFNMVYQISA